MSTTRSRIIFGKTIYLTANNDDTYLKDLIASEFLPEADIAKLISASCQSGDTILDVGANIGYISILITALVPDSKVYAFEPAPATFKFLKKNLKDNNIKNVEAINLGLSNKNATSEITYASDNSSGAFIGTKLDTKLDKDKRITKEKIVLKTLDKEYKKLGIKKCDFLKVDIEGHEPDFLEGAKKFISNFKPTTIIEVNHWCLNVFNRTSLPDFIAQAYDNFPHIFAFYQGEYLDLSNSDSRYKFYYENAVNNKFMNIIAGFNKAELVTILEKAFRNGEALNYQEMKDTIDELRRTNVELKKKYEQLEAALSHKLAKKLNKLLRRGSS